MIFDIITNKVILLDFISLPSLPFFLHTNPNMKAFAVIVFLLGSANHRVTSTFLPGPYPQTRTITSPVIALLPRGGGGGGGGGIRGNVVPNKTSAVVKEQPMSPLQSMKDTFVRLRVQLKSPVKSSGSTTALCQSLILFVGSMFIVIGVNKIKYLFPQQSAFLFGEGMNEYNRPSATALCLDNKSILYAWPMSVSEALSDQSGIVAKISGSFFSFAAILFLVSQIGRPSHFPIKAGHIGSIFNVMRLFAPVIGIFFIPLLPAVGNNSYTSPGKVTEENYHISLAGFSFLLAPILELISSVLDMIKFCEQDPSSNKIFPSDDTDDNAPLAKESSTTSWVDTLYKSLWVGLTLARATIACVVLYCNCVFTMSPLDSNYPAVDTCSVLQVIKRFVTECTLIGLAASMYGVLALSQMCESSGRRLSSLTYILPLIAFFNVQVGKTVSTWLLSFDMKKNYLGIVNMPGGHFSEKLKKVMIAYLEKKGYNKDVVSDIFATCTAQFSDAEMGGIRNECFISNKD